MLTDAPESMRSAIISLCASPSQTLSDSMLEADTERLSPVSEHTSETEFFALFQDLDSLQKQYYDTLSEMRSVKSTLGVEMKVREAAETTCADLEKDKKRLLKSQLASYEQASQQLDYATKYASALESLKEMKDKIASFDKEQEMKISTLCTRHEGEEEALRKQIIDLINHSASKERAIACLEKQLSESISLDSHNQKLQEDRQRLHDNYRIEVGELRKKLELGELNNQKLQADLQAVQHSLLASKSKYDDQLRGLNANRHADVFKQKVMKLRKDNEMLRRQLQGNLHK